MVEQNINPIEKRLAKLAEEGKKAFITYMTAGLPTLEKTVDIIVEQDKAGTDIIELGVPFSDPVADGPVIQNASYQSICQGTNLKKVFEIVKEARTKTEIPIVFMMYYNTILHYGISQFVKTCAETGVNGLIVPDLPYEEQGELKAALENCKEAPLFIELVSPVSKQRVPMILEKARGFVYCVSSMGVTGQKGNFHKDIEEYLSSVKAASKVPVMMGFGIEKAEDVKPYADYIDGAIVGSAFIRLLEENHYDLEIMKNYIKTFKVELS